MTDAAWPAAPVDPIKQRNDAIQAWRNAKAALAKATVAEKLARAEMCKLGFPTGLTEGTNTVDLGAGYKLKVVQPYNYNLDKTDDCKLTDAALDEIEKMGNEGAFISERLVKWKPELSVTEYRALDPKYKVVIDRVLTISPGSPQPEFIEPKG